MTSDKSPAGWYFLLGVLAIYAIVSLVDASYLTAAGELLLSILLKIIPVFLLVFVLMAATNYFVQPKTLVNYLGKGSGAKAWIVSIAAGILSTGPIYLWYPLLSDLQKHGVKNGLVAAFLYNRAVKIPLLPMLVVYFGLAYTIILTGTMILLSIVQGIIIDKAAEQGRTQKHIAR